MRPENFYLGTHEPGWLATAGFPLCIARQRLWRNGRSVPEARVRWMLDSGAFMELDRHGEYTFTPAQYIAIVRRCQDEIGMLDWAAPMDWMCEPRIRAKTGLTVREHQLRTLRNYIDLRMTAPDLPFKLVLTGDEPEDYARHYEMYERHHIHLGSRDLVGLGGICRLQHTEKVGRVLELLPPLNLHGFGFKKQGLTEYGEHFVTADSMAWSYNARRNPPLPGCTHRSCSNCYRRAAWWRAGLLRKLEDAHAA